jgi:nucleoside-diphosphate-sugar epimerase
MARILVIGGAGFIGSHMMKTLVKADHEAVARDAWNFFHERLHAKTARVLKVLS